MFSLIHVLYFIKHTRKNGAKIHNWKTLTISKVVEQKATTLLEAGDIGNCRQSQKNNNQLNKNSD